jgi:hypothetical protein
MVDRILIPLYEKPVLFGEGYFDYKSNYSLNLQLIILPNLWIINYVIGHIGSRHDSYAFYNSRWYQNHRLLFKPYSEE